MASEIQILANRANAQLSTGPVTADGKQRSSHNATALGLFSASAFIGPDEHHAYRKFRTAWNAHLAPDGPVEEALVGELVQAAWRLRRCTMLETATQDATTPEDLDRMQASIDRARAISQRALQRNLNDLRRVQTERQMRNAAPAGHQAYAKLGAASIGDIEKFIDRIAHRYPADSLGMSLVTQRSQKQSQSAPRPRADSAERSQSDPPSTPRNAPCPCASGEKYKRCCGKNAPPVLSHAA